jgi:hypothetical protein
MIKTIRVRYHLGRGENYMKWQIKYFNEDKLPLNTYYKEPEEWDLVMYDCELVNHRNLAQKICNGANKTVCAWIECKSIEYHERDYDIENTDRNFFEELTDDELIHYNPEKRPFWYNKGYSDSGNIDGTIIAKLITRERQIKID